MRVRSVLAVGCAAALLASGCSRGQEANETLPTASSSAAAEATLEPLGPPDLPMPAEAREQTPAGAEAFIRYYMDVYNLAQARTDPEFMLTFSQNCETCEFIASGIASDQQAAYTYDGGLVTVSDVAPPVLNEATAETAFSISQAALTVRDDSGAPVPDLTFPASSSSCGAVLSWSSDAASWTFTQWDIN